MDTRQLTYFLAVVDHQGFTAASAALRITQPALSNTVKQLEKECGVPLLLATDARRILHDLASTTARMRSIAQGRRGQVTLQTCVPLVAAGRGVALVPEQVREIMGAKCVIRKVRESVAQQTAVVGWRTQQPLSPAALRVKDVLLDPATWARPGDAVGPDPALEQEQS